jgi:hypothetical protein
MAKGNDDATIATVAEISFEPISAETLEELSVTDETWLNHLEVIRTAFDVLSRSKEELKQVARKALADDQFSPTECFGDSIGFLSAGVEFMTIAKTRLLCASAAVLEEART